VSILTVLECSRRRTPCGFAEIFGSVLQSGKGGYIFIYCGLPWSLSLGSLLLLERKRIRKTTQAAKAIPHIKLRKVSHSGTEYRKLLPADKEGPVREVQQNTRRRKKVTKRLEYQPQISKSTRHRHCRAKVRVYRDDQPSRPLTIHKNY